MKLPPVITRSARRRRVAFTIRPEDGRLEVLAPLRASDLTMLAGIQGRLEPRGGC